MAAPTLGALQTNFGLAPLLDKPVAIISDARLSGRSDQAVIVERLLSISGEDSMTVDRKYQSAWTGRFGTRIILLTNELPSLADSSGALAGRFITLVLAVSFYGRENPALTGQLLTELSGILNWAREGYLRLRKRGYFIQPASGREAVEQMELLGAPVKAFVRERCTVGPGLEVLCQLLYEDWTAWCEANGKRKPGTQQTFARDLKAAVPGITTIQPRQENSTHRPRYFQGINFARADHQ
jgi:putative DNA primase/helicase